MDASDLVHQLKGVRKSGTDRWLARCPAHEDRHASLSIRQTSEGALLLHCFAGCEISEILSAIGVELRDLFPSDAIPHQSNRNGASRIPIRDVLRAFEHELRIALIVLSDVADGRFRSADRDRAKVASQRLSAFLQELSHR